MRCIVSTQPGGLAAFTYPSPNVMAALTHGGIGQYSRLDRDWEIQKFVCGGMRETIAARWIDALITGGKTDAEAYELLRDRSAKEDWTGIELWDRADVPADRWFRSAWHRSQNGGPISIKMSRAKAIQFCKIADAIAAENATRSEDFDRPLLAIDVSTYREPIANAQHMIELRAIWPKELTCQQ